MNPTTETTVAEPVAVPIIPEPSAAEAQAATGPAPAESAIEPWRQSLALLNDEARSPLAVMMDPAIKKTTWDLAGVFARSAMVPAHFRGKQEDCFIVLHMVDQLRQHPVVLFQNLYFVEGKLGMETKFMLHLVNTRGPFVGGVRFRTSGTRPVPGQEPPDDFTVTAYGIYANGEEASAEASIGMAKAEGWFKRNPKYRSLPEQMLCYRAGAMLTRKCCPEVTMGAYTREELAEVQPPAPLTVGPARALNLKETDKSGAADAVLS